MKGVSKTQGEILRLLIEHPDIALSWVGPLENHASYTGYTFWETGVPRLRFGTFKALLRRGLIVHVANRQARKGWSPMRYYRPATAPEWTRMEADGD